MNSHWPLQPPLVAGPVVGHGPMPFNNAGWYTPISPTPPRPPIDQVDHINIHDFWQTRLAPFPGYSSRPGLYPPNKQNLISISSPALIRERPKLQLLPPRSLAPVNTVPSPIQSDTDTKSENNNVSTPYPLFSRLIVILGQTFSFR
jgi:hypothetical protein